MFLKKELAKGILLFIDLLSFFISLMLSAYFIVLPTLSGDQLSKFFFLHYFLDIICIIWFLVRLKHYSYRKPLWLELKEIIRTLLIFFIIELAILALSKLYISHYLLLIVWTITLILFPIMRIIVKIFLIRIKFFLQETVIIGSGKNAFDTYIAIHNEEYLGLDVKYFICNNDSLYDTRKFSVPILKDKQIKFNSLFSHKSTQVILALEDEENNLRDVWIRRLAKNNFRYISVVPTLRGLPLYSTDMSFLFSYEVMLLRINNNLAKRTSRILKRTMDIFGSIFFIIILSPLLLTLYFLIKKDGGNAIYGHPRVGRNGIVFNCLKFRSMVVNSKEVLEEILKNDPQARAEWEKDFKLKNDLRITKVGHFIRKTSLDELPQLWNVLKGDMSLVGPRPVVKEELERYQDNVDYYLMAKPGMTGLWQVSGRNDVDYDTRVYFDAWYVKNWSLWNDVAILFKTVSVVLKRDGAY